MNSELRKRAICADLATGIRPTECAKKYGVSRRTIYNIKQSLQDAPVKPRIAESFTDWKQELKQLAIPAIKNSLKDTEEVHKAAGTAIQVLKGIGEFAESTNQVSVHFGTIPQSLADRYDDTALDVVVTPGDNSDTDASD